MKYPFLVCITLLLGSTTLLAQYEGEVQPEVEPEIETVTEEQLLEEAAEAAVAEPAPAQWVPRTPPPPVAARPIAESQWNKAVSGVDYSGDIPNPPKTQKPKEQTTQNRTNWPNWDWNGEGLNSFLQVLAIVLLIGMTVWVLWRMLREPRNRSIVAEDGTPITLDNLEAYIHETDLDRFLREALSTGNYAQAVRVYYLQIIKDLSAKEAIKWSREKTNRDYLREMRGHGLSAPFRAATTTYERIWYGNVTLDANEFERVAALMRDVLGRI
jgi:hypothetical protein